MAKPLKPAGPAPGMTTLRDAAMRHLSRFSATEAGLVRVLDRSVQRWAMRAKDEGAEVDQGVASARVAVRQVAAALVEAGVVDDAAFAAARVRRLVRVGRSRRATVAHLTSKGVQPETAEAALPGDDAEFSAAVAYARRRRLGPFRADGAAESRVRDLAAFGRAGFSRAVAESAMALDVESAEAFLLALRQS